MIGRRKLGRLVESSTKAADKVIDVNVWKGAKMIHGIARQVEDPSVKFVDVYREIKELYELVDAQGGKASQRQDQLLRQKAPKRAKVVRRHQTH